MNTTIPNETDQSTTGGRKKNTTAKKHKKGNKVLAAWRDHVKVVAKAEGITYGKEAMQMAKKGNHGKEWSKIKASLHGGAHFNTAGEMVPTPQDEEPTNEEPTKEEPTKEEPKVEDETKVEQEEEPVAEQIDASDESLPDAGTAQQLYGGKRRKSSKKHKAKKSRKSKKHHRSRKN